MTTFALHNLFLYSMAGIGGVLAGMALVSKESPAWKRILSVAFLLSCFGIIGFALTGQ